MNVLLDTCAIIWLANQDERIPTTAKDAIEQAWSRFLIAIAIEQQFTLVTPDPKIRQYPNLKTLW